MGQVQKTARLTLKIIAACWVGGAMWAGASDQADYRSPSALCVDQEGITLYVAQTTDQTVAVFDLESGRVEKSIEVPGTPGDLALSPDASPLYIALAEPDGQVAVVNTANARIINSIPVGHTPTALAVAPDGKVLYVCNRFDNRVAFIDLASGKETASVPVPREPVDVVLSHDGRHLFVANHIPAGPAGHGLDACWRS
jgi:YVTN family beta-propeller protein